MPLTITHFTTDSLPRVVAGAAGTSTLDVLLPFRVDLDDPALAVTGWSLDVEVDGRSWGSRVRTRRLRPGLAGAMRERMARYGRVHLRPSALLRRAARRRRPRRPRGVSGVPRAGRAARGGGDVHAVRDGGPRRRAAPDAHDPTRTLHAVDPRFTRDDVRRIFSPGAFHAGEAWVLHHRRAAGLDQFRIDVADLGWVPERAELVVQVGDTVVDLAAGRYPTLPLVDVAADSVTFAVPHGGDGLPPVTVRYRGGTPCPVDLAARVGVGTARVMFVNFAIQGLNDLFATPDDDYQPPRSYMPATMRDEAASYSSRPGSEENTVGDGYAFTIDAHRRYGIPQMWAMNGGLATLLAHDCRDRRRRHAARRRGGLLVPVVAGYGAHRLPYYTAGTNVDAIRFGARVLEKVLGAARPVYYPDQRLTTWKDNVAGALRSAGMEYVVVDAGTGQGAVPEGAEEAGGNTAIVHAKPPMGAWTTGGG